MSKTSRDRCRSEDTAKRLKFKDLVAEDLKKQDKVACLYENKKQKMDRE